MPKIYWFKLKTIKYPLSQLRLHKTNFNLYIRTIYCPHTRFYLKLPASPFRRRTTAVLHNWLENGFILNKIWSEHLEKHSGSMQLFSMIQIHFDHSQTLIFARRVKSISCKVFRGLLLWKKTNQAPCLWIQMLRAQAKKTMLPFPSSSFGLTHLVYGFWKFPTSLTAISRAKHRPFGGIRGGYIGFKMATEPKVNPGRRQAGSGWDQGSTEGLGRQIGRMEGQAVPVGVNQWDQGYRQHPQGSRVQGKAGSVVWAGFWEGFVGYGVLTEGVFRGTRSYF